MPLFRKKPVVIEAVHFDGDMEPIRKFLGFMPERTNLGGFFILTLEGDMVCRVGDWLIKGTKGEFYPCKSDIFEATYESAE